VGMSLGMTISSVSEGGPVTRTGRAQGLVGSNSGRILMSFREAVELWGEAAHSVALWVSSGLDALIEHYLLHEMNTTRVLPVSGREA
jgi:hypothetical protein